MSGDCFSAHSSLSMSTLSQSSPTYIVHTSTQLSPIQYIRSFFRSRHLKNIVRLLIAPDPATIMIFFLS